jgi:hypothetical protein
MPRLREKSVTLGGTWRAKQTRAGALTEIVWISRRQQTCAIDSKETHAPAAARGNWMDRTLRDEQRVGKQSGHRPNKNTEGSKEKYRRVAQSGQEFLLPRAVEESLICPAAEVDAGWEPMKAIHCSSEILQHKTWRHSCETKNGEGKNHRIGHRAESVKIDYNQQRWKLKESRTVTEKSKTKRGNEGTREKLLRSAVDTKMKTRAAQNRKTNFFIEPTRLHWIHGGIALPPSFNYWNEKWVLGTLLL